MKYISQRALFGGAASLLVAGVFIIYGIAHFSFETEPETPDVPGNQLVEEAGKKGATIRTPLIAHKKVVLRGVDLCPGNSLLSQEAADHERQCVQDVCTTSLDFHEQPIPTMIAINRLYEGKCVQQNFQTERFVRAMSYEGVVAIPQELGKKLRLSDHVVWIPERTEHSRFTEYSAFGVNVSGKINLRYTVPVGQDEFTLDGKVITVEYTQ